MSADGFIQIAPDGTGKRVDNGIIKRGGADYYRQRVEVYAGETLPTQQYYLDSTSGLLLPVKGHDGCMNIVDYLDAIGQGKIPGHEPFTGYGYRSACSAVASGDDVWQGVSATCPIPDQLVGEQFTLASDSLLDAVGGTGVTSVDVHGLDIAGNPQREVVQLNGTTPVSTVRTDWRFCQAIHGETWGALGYAAGTISLYRAGDATRVYNVITTGGSASLNAARMVPAGRKFHLKTRTVGVSGSKAIRLVPRATANFDGDLTNDWRFLFRQPYALQDLTFQEVLPVPEEYPALCIIKCTGFSAQAGGNISFGYTGWIE